MCSYTDAHARSHRSRNTGCVACSAEPVKRLVSAEEAASAEVSDAGLMPRFVAIRRKSGLVGADASLLLDALLASASAIANSLRFSTNSLHHLCCRARSSSCACCRLGFSGSYMGGNDERLEVDSMDPDAKVLLLELLPAPMYEYGRDEEVNGDWARVPTPPRNGE